jgi:HPt (histidine-containing phosphotransfer) domain-containing protein
MGEFIGLQGLWSGSCEDGDRLPSQPGSVRRTDGRTRARDVNDRAQCISMPKPDHARRRTDGPREAGGGCQPLLEAAALQTLRNLSGPGDETFFVEVIDLYLKDSLALVDAIRQAARNRDARALMPAAHSLRSSSGNVGAVRLSAVCRALECAAAGNGMDDIGPLLAQLERIYPLVCRALRVECERTRP